MHKLNAHDWLEKNHKGETITPEMMKEYYEYMKPKPKKKIQEDRGEQKFSVIRVRIPHGESDKCEKCIFFKGILFGCMVKRIDVFDCVPDPKDTKHDYVFQIEGQTVKSPYKTELEE